MSEHTHPSSKKQTTGFDFHPVTDPDRDNNESRSDGDVLLCPSCGNVNLHQERPRIANDNVVRIRFTCEHCPAGHGATLQIKQHEGTTCVRWFR